MISGGGSFGTGQIGDVRVGGNATNFTTLAEEYAITTTPVEGALDAKISNLLHRRRDQQRHADRPVGLAQRLSSASAWTM